MESLFYNLCSGLRKFLKMGWSTHLEVPSRFASSHNFLKFSIKKSIKSRKFLFCFFIATKLNWKPFSPPRAFLLFAIKRTRWIQHWAYRKLFLLCIAVASSFDWFMLRMTISVYLLNVFTLRCVAWKYLPSRENHFGFGNGAGKFMVVHVGGKSIENTFRELTLKIKANLTAP